MALVIQKYGGTSVANIANIEMVAQKVIKAKESGNQVVVVLSAMAGENRPIDQPGSSGGR